MEADLPGLPAGVEADREVCLHDFSLMLRGLPGHRTEGWIVPEPPEGLSRTGSRGCTTARCRESGPPRRPGPRAGCPGWRIRRWGRLQARGRRSRSRRPAGRPAAASPAPPMPQPPEEGVVNGWKGGVKGGRRLRTCLIAQPPGTAPSFPTQRTRWYSVRPGPSGTCASCLGG